jgi:Rps23 Pro-64 3,4-dihydroxylase Tpa1-like proline 4-hydroxylase
MVKNKMGERMKEIIADRNKNIKVYDDVFSLVQRQNMMDYVSNSLFRIGWSDTSVSNNYYSQNQFLHSSYNEHDVKQFKIFEYLKDTDIEKAIYGYKVVQAIVNCSVASDFYFIHSHPYDLVLLYYVNTEWQDGWHGETLFFDENKKDIVFASQFTPNRIILFDGSIPHSIRSQSVIASKYRFTFAVTLSKEL